jgi:hypothetical protein
MFYTVGGMKSKGMRGLDYQFKINLARWTPLKIPLKPLCFIPRVSGSY